MVHARTPAPSSTLCCILCGGSVSSAQHIIADIHSCVEIVLPHVWSAVGREDIGVVPIQSRPVCSGDDRLSQGHMVRGSTCQRPRSRRGVSSGIFRCNLGHESVSESDLVGEVVPPGECYGPRLASGLWADERTLFWQEEAVAGRGRLWWEETVPVGFTMRVRRLADDT
jgi:hypothetical protein